MGLCGNFTPYFFSVDGGLDATCENKTKCCGQSSVDFQQPIGKLGYVESH